MPTHPAQICTTVAWALLLIPISAFAPPSRHTPPLPLRPSPNHRPLPHIPPVAQYASSSTSDQSDDDRTTPPPSSSLSTEQDRALIDAVPRYTVNADEQHPATFWTQLSASTPALSRLSPAILEERYAELSCRPSSPSSSSPSSPSLSKGETVDYAQRPTYPAGPQPPLLDRWCFSDDGGRISGVVAGRNGSMVWFGVVTRGWLADDPTAVALADETSDAEWRGGGWVVALGGVVYELGLPAVPPPSPLPSVAVAIAPLTAPSPSVPLPQIALVSGLATLLLLGAATTGFLAGGGSFNNSPPSTQRTSSTLITAPNPNTPVTTTQPRNPNEPTITNLRIQQERRIAGRDLQLIRTTESITRIQSQLRVDQALLEKDRVGLGKLVKLEEEKGGEAVVRDLNVGSVLEVPPGVGKKDWGELTIAELRGRQERAVAGLELQMVRRTEKVVRLESRVRVDKALMEKDREGLGRLKQLEGERGGGVVIRGQFLELK